MTDDEILVHRVLNAVPARSYAMNALLSLLRVEVSRAVPTAAISCERSPVLRVNPDFVRERCRTDEHLYLLVMHELYHVLLGHTRLFPRATPEHNVAFDAVINSLLVLQHPERAYTSFFLGLYADAPGPYRLLAPPEGTAVTDAALASLHRLLYEGGQTTAEEIFEAIVRRGPTGPNASWRGQPVLLGSHGGALQPDVEDGEWGTEGPVDPGFVQAVRDIVERWPPPAQAIRGRSLCDLLKTPCVAAAPVGVQVLAAMRRALLSAATRGRSTVRRGHGPVQAQVAIPELRDRRGVVLRAARRAPLFYDSLVDSPRGRDADLAHVYLDVSGSMDDYIGHLHGALTALRRHVQPMVGLFSTKVVTVPLADLARGRADSTGGTDIACVLEHLVAHRARRALVITDGYVGRVSEAGVDRVARAGVDVRALLTPAGWRHDLAPLVSRIDELPPLGRGDQRRLAASTAKEGD
jgi:hypothetical protein